MAPLFTGLYPSRHGMDRVGERMGNSAPILAEMLRSHGYATGAVVSRLLLGRRFGFARPGSGRIQGGESIAQIINMLPQMTQQDLDVLRALCDEEIRFTDAGVGRLLGALHASGHDDDTLVVLTADHGQEFLDRGFVGHSRTLYDEVLRVPLFVRLPGREERGRVVQQRVSTVSLTPTVLELLGLEVPELEAQAPSLAGRLRAKRRNPGSIFCEVYVTLECAAGRHRVVRRQSLIGGELKVVRDHESQHVEVSDLGADPHETTNLAESRPDLAGRLLAALDREAARVRGENGPGQTVGRSDEEAELLRGLGYVEP